MMGSLFAATFFLVLSTTYAEQNENPKPTVGKLEHLKNFGSEGSSRNVDIWLPSDYSPNKKYAVLYMHDGQMLFDASTTWNKQAWHVDEVVTQLTTIGSIRNCIVVGPYNRGEYRHTDYFPQKPLSLLPSEIQTKIIKNELKGAPLADQYLKFLVNELKPYIDSHYSTKADVSNTFIAGSSMGGLISMYAMCEYPTVFGGAACISTHWPGSMQVDASLCANAFNTYIQTHLPNKANHKFYFDRGDKTLDALYGPGQLSVDETFKKSGWNSNQYVSLFFGGEDHSEKSWTKRLHLPLTFLLKK
jgi:predicted alpha/beta superfamily hydrolase